MRHEPVMVEEINSTAVNQRQQILVKLGLGFVARLILEPELAELLARPRSVAVAVNFRAAIAFVEIGKFLGTLSGRALF